MTVYKPGDVVLVRFPFTDLASAKKRPALVLSPAVFASRYGDVVVLALTSQKQNDTALRLKRWREAGLPKPTWIKPLIGTLTARLIVRRLGKLAEEDRKKAPQALRLLIAKEFLGMKGS